MSDKGVSVGRRGGRGGRWSALEFGEGVVSCCAGRHLVSGDRIVSTALSCVWSHYCDRTVATVVVSCSILAPC